MRRLLPVIGPSGRVINLSSVSKTPVDPQALAGRVTLGDMAAYSKSKLAIRTWSRVLAKEQKDGPAVIAINPGSMLGSKMVKERFSVVGGDIYIGVRILSRAALKHEFTAESGKYLDIDSGAFARPHPDLLDHLKSGSIVRVIEDCLRAMSDPVHTPTSDEI